MADPLPVEMQRLLYALKRVRPDATLRGANALRERLADEIAAAGFRVRRAGGLEVGLRADLMINEAFVVTVQDHARSAEVARLAARAAANWRVRGIVIVVGHTRAGLPAARWIAGKPIVFLDLSLGGTVHD